MTYKYWLATDYISWKGGTNNLQRTRIMVSGMSGYIKCFTSESDKTEKRAIAWAKKNKIKIEGMTDYKDEYQFMKQITGRGLCGIVRNLFTVGIFTNIDEEGYDGRYCFSNMKDAKEALDKWKDEPDPPGDWIKYKGLGGDRRRATDNTKNQKE